MAPMWIAKCVMLGGFAMTAGAPTASPCGEGESETCAGDTFSTLQVKSEQEKEIGRHGSVDFDAVRKDAIGHLAKEIERKPALVAEDVETCRYEDGSGCGLSSLKAGALTKVYPGGGTACMDGGDYFFQVYPGDSEKLLYYFQGGGACWDQMTYMGHACSQSGNLEFTSGILDMEEARNPYKGWTKVVVTYCSGDIHTGNTTQAWGAGGVKQVGYLNALSVYDWARANFPKLTSLVFGGCSAGSLGMQFWSHKLATSFNLVGSKPVFFADSFMGAFYPSTPDQYLQTTTFLASTWNLCSTGLLPEALAEQCTKGKMDTNDPYITSMEDYPDMDFNIINSKTDGTQVYFGKAITATLQNTEGAQMTPAQYYASVNRILQDYNKEPDYSAFLVEGTQHCYTNYDFVYTTSVAGKDAAPGGAPKLIDWMASFTKPLQGRALSEKPAAKSAAAPVTKTVCKGPEEDVSASSEPTSTSYCDDDLV